MQGNEQGETEREGDEERNGEKRKRRAPTSGNVEEVVQPLANSLLTFDDKTFEQKPALKACVSALF